MRPYISQSRAKLALFIRPVKNYESDPWSETRFDLFYSAVGRYWAFQVHFLLKKVGVSFGINKCQYDFDWILTFIPPFIMIPRGYHHPVKQ